MTEISAKQASQSGPSPQSGDQSTPVGDPFLNSVTSLSDFSAVADPGNYCPVPEDWWMGLTDVVGSTEASETGRFKAVNAAGASAISAMMNAIGGDEFPFVFGGDGCAFLVRPEHANRANDVLSKTAAWVRDDLGLQLRAACVPLHEIKASGQQVDIAYFQASDHVRYAMFDGGGLRWAEDQMKAGNFLVEPAKRGARPNLAGLSCRWTPIRPELDTILSLIVVPTSDRDAPRSAEYHQAMRELLTIASAIQREGRPAPEGGPGFTWPPDGLDIEARASRGTNSVFRQRLAIGAMTLLAWIVDQIGKPVGGFDPLAYRTNTSKNADYRKYDDGLHLTLDCDRASETNLMATLEKWQSDEVLLYGTHRQEAALMTCIVPSIHSHSHFHFIDGAEGGYTQAARALKEKLRKAK